MLEPILHLQYANKNINPGFRNVQSEMSASEYPGLIVKPRVNYEQCET